MYVFKSIKVPFGNARLRQAKNDRISELHIIKQSPFGIKRPMQETINTAEVAALLPIVCLGLTFLVWMS